MGNFKFHGADVAELAREYGTPLYVVSEDEIVRRIREIKGCFDDKSERCSTFFASKSFLTKDMLRILTREGLGLDVVSEGELFLARQMRFPPEKIAFHGNSKTEREIAAGLDYGVGKFVCDSVEEIELIGRMAKERSVRANVLIRVTPGVEAHTHRYMSTGQAGSKFGLPPESIKDAVTLCLALPNISLAGFHFHVGSQLMDNSTHIEALGVVLGLIKKTRDECGFKTRILDMGGGFGVRYTKKDGPQGIADFIGGMTDNVELFCHSNGIERPDLVIEPGRWIVADAGITLYTVGSVKRLPGGVVYVGVDGGYSDNPRPALYGAEYDAILAGKAGKENLSQPETVSIAGKCCESGDILIQGIKLPEAERGDLIAVLGTGAYCHSMANNYNKNPIPAVVMIKDGSPRLSVRRQSYEEMFSGNI
jgi:diaminopimelate decarboxylase